MEVDVKIEMDVIKNWNGIGIISEVVLKQKMQHSPKFSDKPELTATEMARILFYEAPWNVIVAPTQEGKIYGIVRSQ